jgi:hypothetical protein
LGLPFLPTRKTEQTWTIYDIVLIVFIIKTMKILSMLPAGDLPPLDGVPSLGRLHFSYIPLNKKGYFHEGRYG